MINKELIRPIYAELRGYLAQAPEAKASYESIDDETIWNQFNNVIGLLKEITNKDYSRFIIEPLKSSTLGDFIRIISYRQKLAGLIFTIHAEYFSDEAGPLDGGPSTIISQSQQQAQAVNIQMILEVQSKIDENINKYEEGSKEKGFLKKVKSSLSSIQNVIQLVSLFLNTAKEFGISIEEILRILRI